MIQTRRQFLASSALASGAGFALAAEPTGCGAAMGTYGFQSETLEEAIRAIAAIGFDAVEITVFPDSSGDPEGALKSSAKRAEISRLIQDSGLRLAALMADLRPSADETEGRRQLGGLARLVKLAKDLAPDSPPLIQTTLGGKDWKESKTLFRDTLAHWNQILADLKGQLAIKPHRGNAMSTPSHAAWLLRQLGEPRRLGMVYDYSHYAFRGPELSIHETVAEALPVTRYVAVKDAHEVEGRVRFALPGETDSWDHADVIQGLYAGGYRGDFCCEVSSQIWREEGYDAMAAARLSYRNLNAAFERAEVPRRGRG